MSVRDQSVFRSEPTTTGVVDADAMLLGRSSIFARPRRFLVTVGASCCASNVPFHRLVGDSFGADHDGRGRRRRSASWPVGDSFGADYDGRGRRRRALLGQSVTRSEPTTAGLVDAVAALLGPTLGASCCEPPPGRTLTCTVETKRSLP